MYNVVFLRYLRFKRRIMVIRCIDGFGHKYLWGGGGKTKEISMKNIGVKVLTNKNKKQANNMRLKLDKHLLSPTPHSHDL